MIGAAMHTAKNTPSDKKILFFEKLKKTKMWNQRDEEIYIKNLIFQFSAISRLFFYIFQNQRGMSYDK